MVSPQNRAERKPSATRAVNLAPYRANYFGHKLHIKLHIKLVALARLLSALFVKLFNPCIIVIILPKLSVLNFTTFHFFMF